MSKYDIRRDFEYQNRILNVITKIEKRKTNNEKRKANNEKRKTNNEKRKTKSEKRKTKNKPTSHCCDHWYMFLALSLLVY